MNPSGELALRLNANMNELKYDTNRATGENKDSQLETTVDSVLVGRIKE